MALWVRIEAAGESALLRGHVFLGARMPQAKLAPQSGGEWSSIDNLGQLKTTIAILVDALRGDDASALRRAAAEFTLRALPQPQQFFDSAIRATHVNFMLENSMALPWHLLFWNGSFLFERTNVGIINRDIFARPQHVRLGQCVTLVAPNVSLQLPNATWAERCDPRKTPAVVFVAGHGSNRAFSWGVTHKNDDVTIPPIDRSGVLPRDDFVTRTGLQGYDFVVLASCGAAGAPLWDRSLWVDLVGEYCGGLVAPMMPLKLSCVHELLSDVALPIGAGASATSVMRRFWLRSLESPAQLWRLGVLSIFDCVAHDVAECPHTLVATDGKSAFKLEPLRTHRIGRAQSSDVLIPSGRVSREHAQLEWCDNGFLLRDKGSANGTFVNGHRIAEHRLQLGDVIEIGPASYRYIIDIFEYTEPKTTSQIPSELSAGLGATSTLREALREWELNKGTGCLSVISRSGHGMVMARQGQPWGAWFEGRNSPESPVEFLAGGAAVRQLVGLERCRWTMLEDEIDEGERLIHESFSELLFAREVGGRSTGMRGTHETELNERAGACAAAFVDGRLQIAVSPGAPRVRYRRVRPAIRIGPPRAPAPPGVTPPRAARCDGLAVQRHRAKGGGAVVRPARHRRGL